MVCKGGLRKLYLWEIRETLFFFKAMDVRVTCMSYIDRANMSQGLWAVMPSSAEWSPTSCSRWEECKLWLGQCQEEKLHSLERCGLWQHKTLIIYTSFLFFTEKRKINRFLPSQCWEHKRDVLCQADIGPVPELHTTMLKGIDFTGLCLTYSTQEVQTTHNDDIFPPGGLCIAFKWVKGETSVERVTGLIFK